MISLVPAVICEDDILAQSLKEDSRIDNECDEEFSFDNKIPDDKVSEAKTEDSNVQGRLSNFDGDISQSTDIIEAPTRIDDYSEKFTIEEKTSESVKDQFDGFYDFNQPDAETSEPEIKSSD